MILQTSVCLHKRVRLQEKVDQSSSSFFVFFLVLEVFFVRSENVGPHHCPRHVRRMLTVETLHSAVY